MNKLHPNTVRRLLSDLLLRVDLPDPHAFATAYVNHAEISRGLRSTPMPVSIAIQRWLSLGSI